MGKNYSSCWNVPEEILSTKRKQEIRRLCHSVPKESPLIPLDILHLADHEGPKDASEILPLIEKHSKAVIKVVDDLSDDEMQQFDGMDRGIIKARLHSLVFSYALNFAPKNAVEAAYLEGLQDSLYKQLAAGASALSKVALDKLGQRIKEDELFGQHLENFINKMELNIPYVRCGRKVKAGQLKSGKARRKQIRFDKGAVLSDRLPELRNRLNKYTKEGMSKSQACIFLAKKEDIPWSAEYLRKKL